MRVIQGKEMPPVTAGLSDRRRDGGSDLYERSQPLKWYHWLIAISMWLLAAFFEPLMAITIGI